MQEEKNAEKIKILFLHEAGVGTTNIINVTIGIPFNDRELSTSTFYFVDYSFIFKGNKYILKLWDTIGQEQFMSLTKILIKGSNIVIFVYDITNRFTFCELNYWISSAKQILGENVIFGIMGAKIDLYFNQEISDEEAYKFAESNKMKLKYVSAKDNPKGIRDFLEELASD